MTGGVATSLTEFKGALNTDIKDDIYEQVGFLKDDIIAFADQIIYSFQNEFGKCKVRFKLLD